MRELKVLCLDDDPIIARCLNYWLSSHKLDQTWCALFKTESYKRLQKHRVMAANHYYWLIARRTAGIKTVWSRTTEINGVGRAFMYETEQTGEIE